MIHGAGRKRKVVDVGERELDLTVSSETLVREVEHAGRHVDSHDGKSTRTEIHDFTARRASDIENPTAPSGEHLHDDIELRPKIWQTLALGRVVVSPPFKDFPRVLFNRLLTGGFCHA
jgi:hypothetical protein